MRSKLVSTQLVAFVVIALLGIIYVGAKYVRIDQLLGFGQYTVTGQFADSGGIFQNAEVTYRGIPVGRVGALTLTEQGVDVALNLEKGGPDIPSDTVAVVANRSAIGEQYVDLQPRTDQGPFLEDGSTIAEADTSTPTPVEDLLRNVDTLASTVPKDDLRTLVTELGTGFEGTGTALAGLVDSLDTFSQDGLTNLPQTLTLIRDSRVVLDTQSEQSSAIQQFSSDLALVTAQLRSNDPDIRRLIDNGIPFSDETSALVSQAGPGLTTNLTNLAGVSEALSPRTFALRPLLQFLPALAQGANSVSPGDGTIHFGIALEVNNPPSCTQGYEGTQAIIDAEYARNPDFDPTQQDFPINLDANCTVPQGSLTGVRGANRAQFADPNIPQPWDGKPKVAPDPIDLNPIATQLAALLGVTVRP
ncbi:phospholipid/cholesterol/gamma-HCH transport system substrate-binding protein [Rhodococcoides kroppenstedtii]|uniref:Phospholipid/cholesterol/gamma-HCH transport system substrate-binding protein n=1 Tax=Rhodococcoides kroppenstedtii TaxID=293050 RepID=A0A1I0TK14_9NOCA|nr:MlaD family protein [Rhodococcus kroppenstedtii]MBT1190943.1 MCE family protein [Rhodococcus kroppenstedtii]SFA52094.1 phospholipid/cholesterol/gamma-HCH transport system substrate-binding protein [Rhodococcus kroppenstedtii]